MTSMSDIFGSRAGKILISLLWGFALSMFFRKTCAGNSCRVVKVPEASEIEGRIYRFSKDGPCYRFKPKMTRCVDDE